MISWWCVRGGAGNSWPPSRPRLHSSVIATSDFWVARAFRPRPVQAYPSSRREPIFENRTASRDRNRGWAYYCTYRGGGGRSIGWNLQASSAKLQLTYRSKYNYNVDKLHAIKRHIILCTNNVLHKIYYNYYRYVILQHVDFLHNTSRFSQRSRWWDRYSYILLTYNQ